MSRALWVTAFLLCTPQLAAPAAAEPARLDELALEAPFVVSGVEIPAGTYRIEASGEDTLRLSSPGADPIEVAAAPISHRETVDGSEAVLIEPGDGSVHLLLLSADGEGLEAVGTSGGVAPRGRVAARASADAVRRATILGRAQAASAALEREKENSERYAEAISTLQHLAAQQPPRQSSERERLEWSRQSQALETMATRISNFRRQKKASAEKLEKGLAQLPGLSVAGALVPGGAILGSALGSALGGLSGIGLDGPAQTGANLVTEMMQMNMQFLALQGALQMESRKYQAVSKAAQSRHQLAMRTIANLK